LDRAVREGLDVRYLLNLYDADSGRVAFHGVRAKLIARQAVHMGLAALQRPVPAGAFEAEFVAALGELRGLGVAGLIFGNIHLTDVRGWYEERVRGAGLDHIEPLWGEDPAAVTAEVVTRGYRARIVSVNLELGRRSWLGRELNRDLASELASASGVDAAGERGEFHSYVYDGPLFSSSVAHELGQEVEFRGHALIDLVPAADEGVGERGAARPS